jgi:hypothetical protein
MKAVDRPQATTFQYQYSRRPEAFGRQSDRQHDNKYVQMLRRIPASKYLKNNLPIDTIIPNPGTISPLIPETLEGRVLSV